MRATAWMTLVLVASGCGDLDDDAADAGTEDAEGEVSRPECATDACTDHFAVAQTIDYVFPDDAGTLDGFDIDGRVSDEDDTEGCNQQDYVSADGREGIDSQSSILMRLLMDINGEAIDGYTKTAIADGDLLMVTGIEGVDDPMDDDCVIVSAFPVVGSPFLGTDGLIAANQTFDPHPDHPIERSECASMKDGVVTGGPFESIMPIYIVQLSVDVRVHDTHIRAELHDDGSMDVLSGGGAETDQLFELVLQSGEAAEIALATATLDSLADLEPNEEGQCQQLSQTMTMAATPAFLF